MKAIVKHYSELSVDELYAIGFYEKFGFRVCSEEFMEDGIPHVKMTLTLS